MIVSVRMLVSGYIKRSRPLLEPERGDIPW